ncbi:MAG: aminotransferase class I/II-fold pyridoxal phosphate-dependent enzyme [Spirochaetes bacterium]|nr:aminotransferase class I/II-fold pyridoxal phosphate-dependent enzyme [Spirochaetota bacterium]MBU0957127.1 aminotransferase class I/II-fold pyridoxal phosphate-dependent enzyme [Spirochaetota bacterium]
MNILAEELNRSLSGTCAGRLLSDLGQRMFFPKGLLSQSAEATERAHKFNATVGMAYSGGQPIMLEGVRQQLPGLSPKEAVAYGPTSGVMAFRELWRKEILRKNPSMKGKACSLPVSVPGLTAGVSYLADLFIDSGDTVVVPDMFWPNYRLIIEERHCAKMEHYSFFDDKGGFNVPAMEAAIRKSAATRKRSIVILNFPNNPTGYTPSLSEAAAIQTTLLTLADSGIDLLVIMDDAYFGLQYEADNLRESMFARLAGAHERILAAKVDGSTKEDYVWGFRGGFITFAGKGLDEHQYGALVKKLMGVIRSSVSSPAAPTQYIMMKAMEHPGYLAEKEKYAALMETRYHAVKRWLATHPAPAGLRPLPFNSGYFMCFLCEGYSAEALRLRLLDEHGIGTISLQEKWLRVAFSCIEEADIDELYSTIYKAAAGMKA